MTAQRHPSLTPEHRMKIAASKVGMPFDEYRRHVEAGEKWCCGHHDWHVLGRFATRSALPDGLDNICREIDRERAAPRMRRLYARRRAERQAVAL